MGQHVLEKWVGEEGRRGIGGEDRGIADERASFAAGPKGGGSRELDCPVPALAAKERRRHLRLRQRFAVPSLARMPAQTTLRVQVR